MILMLTMRLILPPLRALGPFLRPMMFQMEQKTQMVLTVIFLIQVSGIAVGITPGSTGGLTVASSHDSYQAASTSGAVILTGGSTTSGSAHGVETAQFTLDGKVMLDWATDIPGAYALTITLTIASQ